MDVLLITTHASHDSSSSGKTLCVRLPSFTQYSHPVSTILTLIYIQLHLGSTILNSCTPSYIWAVQYSTHVHPVTSGQYNTQLMYIQLHLGSTYSTHVHPVTSGQYNMCCVCVCTGMLYECVCMCVSMCVCVVYGRICICVCICVRVVCVSVCVFVYVLCV